MRRDGSEIGEREVVVPIRDQISNPDIDREESDPHAHVRCTVCHDSKDESLLLLCDLCETAAHTYCVGLGVTVPEGDWFCEDCVTLRAELSNHETRADISLPTTPCPTKGVPPAKVQVSVFDIIKEPQERRTSEIHRLLRWTHPRKCWTLSTISSNSAGLGLAGEGRPAAKEFLTSRDEVVDSAVTVPNGCQNTYQNMRDLCEKWAPFKCGTMSFSSSTLGASGKGSISLDTMSTDGSFDQASLPKENVTRNKDKQQYVVHKAWKLLKSAMSMQQAEKEHQANKVVSGTPLRKIGSSSKSKNHTASKSLPSKFKNQGSTRLKMRGDTSGGSLCERSKKKQHGSKRQYGAAAPTNDLVLSSSELQKQFLASIHHEQASIESDGEVNRVSSHDRFRFDEFPSLRTSAGLMGKFTSNPSKLQRTSLPSTNSEYPEAVEKGHQTCSDINSRPDGGPKAEIQSLVKLSL